MAGSGAIYSTKCECIASFPGSTAQRYLHFGKTQAGSLGSLDVTRRLVRDVGCVVLLNQKKKTYNIASLFTVLLRRD